MAIIEKGEHHWHKSLSHWLGNMGLSSRSYHNHSLVLLSSLLRGDVLCDSIPLPRRSHRAESCHWTIGAHARESEPLAWASLAVKTMVSQSRSPFTAHCYSITQTVLLPL